MKALTLTLVTVIVAFLALSTDAGPKYHAPMLIGGEAPTLISRTTAPDPNPPHPVLYVELTNDPQPGDGPSIMFTRQDAQGVRYNLGRVSGIIESQDDPNWPYDGAVQISVVGHDPVNGDIELGGLARKPVATFSREGVAISDINTVDPKDDEATRCYLQVRAGQLYLKLPDGTTHRIALAD